MGYILKQFNKTKGDGTDNLFMSEKSIANIQMGRQADSPDSKSWDDAAAPRFYNECLYFDSGNSFSEDNIYYVHCKIKRLQSPQTFYVKLAKHNANEDIKNDQEQYLTTYQIETQGPGKVEWVDIEFIFAPMISFDCLVFELVRGAEDYGKARYPKIIYLEVSQVKNLLTSIKSSGINLIRLGVQSKSNLFMCINGEEIRTSKSGIYELKNGVMTVSFFSVCTPLQNESDDEIINIMKAENKQSENKGYDYYQHDVKNGISSYNKIYIEKKAREIDSFTLDYLYEE